MNRNKFAEQCAGCAFWRPLSSARSENYKRCHHLLDTGHCKRVENGICLSRDVVKPPMRDMPFDVLMEQRGL